MLPIHQDDSTHSATIALNGHGQFEGGGTFFESLKRAVHPQVGCTLTFRGDLRHGGDPVTSGVRYIIALFLYAPAEGPVALESKSCFKFDFFS
jgi:hypothetical protein